MHENEFASKTYFRMKGFAPELVLKQTWNELEHGLFKTVLTNELHDLFGVDFN